MVSIRRLPHSYPEDRWIFLTWHLHGALRTSQAPPATKILAGRAFILMDRILDSARGGPMFLRQVAIADLIVSSLRHGVTEGSYDLANFFIMANHVHVLLRPTISVSKIMKSLKGYTAREANRLLGRTGYPFWQKESYDHWVPNDEERTRIAAYIENNPVKAGLVLNPQDYRWSSAYVDTTVDAARLEARATNSQGA